MSTAVLPVRVRATLDPGLGRWLWLVKWFLAIPHYLLLALLWPVFLVLTVVAMFAILFTGRYPRSIFDFNVGVLRWTWRVAYYSYGALGTDQYPPFTLDEVPEYPAHLEIEYPDHLSQGLVLVKWWLLAIPHYLVLAFFIGGGARAATWTLTDEQVWLWNGGLIGLLAFVAAVVLLVTGSYPRSVFDLLLGMNRWVLRVAAYSGLMTDEYPPFRLDMGPDEPGPGQLAVGPGQLAVGSRAPEDAVAPPPPGPSRGNQPGEPRPWSAGRIVVLVLGSLMLLGSLGVGAAGGVLALADKGLRDGQGYFMSGQQSLSSPGYAVVSDRVELHLEGAGRFVPDRVIGDVKVTVTPRSNAPVFVGIARAADAATYLAGVQHSVVLDFTFRDGRAGDPTYRQEAGGPPAAAPEQTNIWAARASGAGKQTLLWPAESGDWAVVVMNADGTRPVFTEVAVGATFPSIGVVVAILLVVAVCLLALAVLFMVVALRTPTRRPPASGAPPPGPPASEAPPPGPPAPGPSVS